MESNLLRSGPLSPTATRRHSNVAAQHRDVRTQPLSERPAFGKRKPKRQVSQPMPEWQKHILRINSTLMKKNICFSDSMLLHYLFESCTLSSENLDTLNSMSGRPQAQQVHKLLAILEGKGAAGFYNFVKALKEVESYEYIWEKLESDEEKYNSSCNLRETFTTDVSTKSSDEQLFVDERNNTYIVSETAMVSTVTESKIRDMRSNLWDLCTTVQHSGTSDYEEIPCLILQESPQSSCGSLSNVETALTLNVQEYLKDYCEPADIKIEKGQQLLLDTELTGLLIDIFDTEDYGLLYNSQRNLMMVQMCKLKSYCDIAEEKWYYPTLASSRQMTDWLSESKLRGCFYIYQSTNNNLHGSDYAPYTIGLCHNEMGDVTHYRIIQNENNELQIGDVKNNKGMKFDSIQNLVKYFRGTRGCLKCRLRWSPKELSEPRTVGCTIPAEGLDVKERIACHDDGNHISDVYKGQFSDRNVAIKRPAKLPLGKIEEDDFLSEAKILSQLSHKNIIKLEGVCYTGEKIQLVLEYADNGDLRTCLRNGLIDSADIRKTLPLWMQLLDALLYLKSQRYIIHRDVAARNCLIHGKTKLKLSDFGMAAKVEQHDEFIPDKGEDFSYRWAAPDILVQRLFSTASDVWAAGVVFWEMATGAKDPPYKDLKDYSKVEKKVASGTKLAYCKTMARDYKVVMKDIVMKCWEKEPDDRPTAQHLLHSCEKHLNTLNGGENLYDSREPIKKEETKGFFRQMSDRWKKK